jgi:hypothetical protein
MQITLRFQQTSQMRPNEPIARIDLQLLSECGYRRIFHGLSSGKMWPGAGTSL